MGKWMISDEAKTFLDNHPSVVKKKNRKHMEEKQRKVKARKSLMISAKKRESSEWQEQQKGHLITINHQYAAKEFKKKTFFISVLVMFFVSLLLGPFN
jgi:ribosomal 30S subunit maturation factor RimM